MKKTIICAAFTIAGAIFLGFSALGINFFGSSLDGDEIMFPIMFFLGFFMFLVGFISCLIDLFKKDD